MHALSLRNVSRTSTDGVKNKTTVVVLTGGRYLDVSICVGFLYYFQLGSPRHLSAHRGVPVDQFITT